MRFVMMRNWINIQGLTKDFSMIPFILRKYYDYDAELAAPNTSGGEIELPDFLAGHKITYLDNKIDAAEAGANFIVREAKSIDMLGLFGMYPYVVEWAKIYKRNNPKGKIYLKMDLNVYWLGRIGLTKEHREFLDTCDIISVENKILYELLNDKWPYTIEYIPNGFYSEMFKEDIPYSKKENIILTVGRLGTPQKRTEVLMEAYARCEHNIPDWNLILTGSIEKGFDDYINNYFKKYPKLKEKVQFTGKIDDKDAVRDLFYRAKVFCLPSVLEAMAHVLFEALVSRDFLVMSDIEEANEITNAQKHGRVFKVDDVTDLASVLTEVCNDEEAIKEAFYKTREYANARYDWIKICFRLNLLIRQVMESGVE